MTWREDRKVTCPACGATNRVIIEHGDAPDEPSLVAACFGCGETLFVERCARLRTEPADGEQSSPVHPV